MATKTELQITLADATGSRERTIVVQNPSSSVTSLATVRTRMAAALATVSGNDGFFLHPTTGYGLTQVTGAKIITTSDQTLS